MKQNDKKINKKMSGESTAKNSNTKIPVSTSLLSDSIHQTFLKSLHRCVKSVLCSHNHAHNHIKPKMGLTKEGVP